MANSPPQLLKNRRSDANPESQTFWHRRGQMKDKIINRRNRSVSKDTEVRVAVVLPSEGRNRKWGQSDWIRRNNLCSHWLRAGHSLPPPILHRFYHDFSLTPFYSGLHSSSALILTFPPRLPPVPSTGGKLYAFNLNFLSFTLHAA